MNFNLLDERFIPVIWSDGQVGRVGIRRALAEAGRIRQIAASNPMDNIALLRLLLAVLYWCKGAPPGQGEKDRILAAGQFSADWFDKLDQQKDCFNLLGDGKRFYQDKAASRLRSTTELLQEIPTGNNFSHFRHSNDGEEGLCPGCCALGLLRTTLFSVSGLPDLKAGINGTPPIYVVPIGPSLLHSLTLNWISQEALGVPAWEHPRDSATIDEAVPILRGLTTLARRVWLHEPTSPGGVCIGCGNQEPELIRTCEYQSAGTHRNDLWDDPHVIYTYKSKDDETKKDRRAVTSPDLTKRFFRLDKPWSLLLSGIVASGNYKSHSKSTRLLIVGFATDKAKNVDVWERICTLPPDSATESLRSATEARIGTWDKEGRSLPRRIKPKGCRSPGNEFTAAIAAIRPHVECRVSADVEDLLVNPETAWQRAAGEYRAMMSVTAKSLSPGFTTRALQRRIEIATTKPDMTPKPQKEATKPNRKKGGSK